MGVGRLLDTRAQRGLTAPQLDSSLRACVNGETATGWTTPDDDEVGVVLRLHETQRERVEQLRALPVAFAKCGTPITLNSVAATETVFNPEDIRRPNLQPIAIMASLPLALIGVMPALLFWKSTLNVFSMIGLVMLMGLVTKNAILLVDFANHARKLGATVPEALLQAGLTRMRPIILTTAARSSRRWAASSSAASSPARCSRCWWCRCSTAIWRACASPS